MNNRKDNIKMNERSLNKINTQGITEEMDMIKMDYKDIEERQCSVLREFDKKLYEYTGKMATIRNIVVIAMVIMFMWFPIQILMEDDFKIVIFYQIIWGCITAHLFLDNYVNATESMSAVKRGKVSDVYEKLKYVPISRKQYKSVRMGYLNNYLLKITTVGLVIQCGISIISGDFGIINVLYTIGVLYILPMLYSYFVEL